MHQKQHPAPAPRIYFNSVNRDLEINIQRARDTIKFNKEQQNKANQSITAVKEKIKTKETEIQNLRKEYNELDNRIAEINDKLRGRIDNTQLAELTKQKEVLEEKQSVVENQKNKAVVNLRSLNDLVNSQIVGIASLNDIIKQKEKELAELQQSGNSK
jgi:chromosome segregation ATPase